MSMSSRKSVISQRLRQSIDIDRVNQRDFVTEAEILVEFNTELLLHLHSKTHARAHTQLHVHNLYINTQT